MSGGVAIPAKACIRNILKILDSAFRRNDGKIDENEKNSAARFVRRFSFPQFSEIRLPIGRAYTAKSPEVAPVHLFFYDVTIVSKSQKIPGRCSIRKRNCREKSVPAEISPELLEIFLSGL